MDVLESPDGSGNEDEEAPEGSRAEGVRVRSRGVQEPRGEIRWAGVGHFEDDEAGPGDATVAYLRPRGFTEEDVRFTFGASVQQTPVNVALNERGCLPHAFCGHRVRRYRAWALLGMCAT